MVSSCRVVNFSVAKFCILFLTACRNWQRDYNIFQTDLFFNVKHI